MRWAVWHRTAHLYSEPVQDNDNQARLQPVTNDFQKVESFNLTVKPAAKVDYLLDFYGNWVHHFDVFAPHTSIEVIAESLVTTLPSAPLAEDARPAPLELLTTSATYEAGFDFTQASRFTDTSPMTWRMAVDATEGCTDVWQAAVAIRRFVHQYLTYDPNSTHVHTLMREALAQKRGVCQDYAHVMIGFCRALKIPARYVSGYLASDTADASHAWTEVYIPTLGWRGLDATHNAQPGETYIKLGVGRDYNDVPPLRGLYRGNCSRRKEVEVRIRQLPDPPLPTSGGASSVEPLTLPSKGF